jgi:putative transposase
MKDQFSILTLCETLEVSRSGYYDWANRLLNPGPRALQNQELAADIKAIHKEHRQTYGSPRIVQELRRKGHTCGRNRAARIMKQEGIYGRQKGRFRVKTTDSAHDHPIAPNHLAEAPKPTAPNQQWAADITYIQTAEGWLYLAAILDLYSRKIVGWALSERIDSALVLQALAMSLRHRKRPSGLLFHSDRGVQYACGDFRAALASANLIPSMSRKGNCYDNAAMESFWSTLKLEMAYRTEFQTRRQARSEIFDYIEVFYNRKRIHSSLNYLSPVDF